MDIKYLVVRPSGYSKPMSRYAATSISAFIHQVPTWVQLNLSAKDILGISFEQALLSNYLLEMNPNSKALKSYREKCTHTFEKMLKHDLLKESNLDKEHILKNEVESIAQYVTGNHSIKGVGLENILQRFTAGASKYTTVPLNFSYPYIQFDSVIPNEDYLYSPVVLSPVTRVGKEDKKLEITFYCRPYTNLNPGKNPYFDKDNRTLAYICSMNHNGKSWKELIDVIQSLHIKDNTPAAFESLSGILNDYILGESQTRRELKSKKQNLLNALQCVYKRDALIIDRTPEELNELVSLFSYLGDNRLNYLLEEDPTVGMEDFWNAQLDLQFLTPLSLKGYAMAADDSEGDSDGGDDGGDAGNDEGGDSGEDNNEEGDGDDELEEEGDDLFGDDDDFADEGDDSGDEGGDSEGGSGSDSSSDTSSSEESSETTEPSDDVNPVIELIDDETFDEYLDRGILDIRIKRMILTPPTSLSSSDVEFLKYWYLVWFPCVSVATTKEILGKLLVMPAKKITPKE